jgi:2'-5' RNA ligase superfamily
VVAGVWPDDRMSALTRHHVTAFVDPAVSGPVEELRRRWDPQMAGQIAAHVTVVYPEEIPDPASLRERAAAAATTAPFDLVTGPAFYDGSPCGGVFLHVHDLDGGLRAFRTAAVPAGSMISFPPHITIVHPRTSGLGEQAWAELAACSLSIRFTVTCVAITAFDGDRWPALRVLHLGRHHRMPPLAEPDQ